MSSHYDVLGVARTASAEELRHAYRQAAKACHPDSGGTADAFAHVQDAWAVLGHPARRRDYDGRNPGSRADAAPSSTSASTAGGPAVTAPRSAPAPATHRDPPESRLINPDEPTTPTWTRLASRRSARILCAAVAIGAGAATTWVAADLGRPVAAAAGLHMSTTGLLVARRMTGKTTGEGTYRGLVRGAWILAAGLALIALLGWAMHHSPWPPLLWSAGLALYAASLSALWRTALPATKP